MHYRGVWGGIARGLPAAATATGLLLAATGLLDAGTARAQDCLSIDLAQSNTSSPPNGITQVDQDNANTTVITEQGTAGRSTAPPAGMTGGFITFAVDKSFINTGLDAQGKPVTDLWLTVKYFDQGTDAFVVEYDATAHPEDLTLASMDDPDLDIHRVAGPPGGADRVVKTNSGQWLTHTFHLTQVYMGKREEGNTDFRIDDLGDGPEEIASVDLCKTQPVGIEIPQAAAAPKIDGVLNDPAWTSAGSFMLCSAAQDTMTPSSWKGPDDYCATIKMAWDAQALYIADDAVDDVPRVNDQPCGLEWNGDGFELFWGFDDSSPGRSQYIAGSDFHWYVKAYPSTSSPGWAYETQPGSVIRPNGDCSADGDVAVADRTDGKKGYIMETQFPWSLFQGPDGTPHAPPAAGQVVGFAFLGNDGDGSLPGFLEKSLSFMSVSGAASNPSAWTTARLMGSGGTMGGGSGDLNGDGKVDIRDATLSLQIAVGSLMPTAAQQTAGDVNGDGKLNIQDTTLILRKAVGI